MAVDWSELTEQERLICLLVVDDKDNRDIADALNISNSTLRRHLYNIYGKLNVKRRLGLVELLRSDLKKPFF